MFTKVVVTVPPGRLGVNLMDSGSDGKGTVVSHVTSNSPLAGKVFHGDKLIDINGTDVHEMNTSGILGILQQYSTDEKTITIIRDIPKHKQVHKSEASVSHSPVDESLKPEPVTVSPIQSSRSHKHHHHHPTSKSSKHPKKKNPHKKNSTLEEESRGSEPPPRPAELVYDSSLDKKNEKRHNSSNKNSVALESIVAQENEGPPVPPGMAAGSVDTKSGKSNGSCFLSFASTASGEPPVPVGMVFDDSLISKSLANTNRSKYSGDNESNKPESRPPAYLELPTARDDVSTISISSNRYPVSAAPDNTDRAILLTESQCQGGLEQASNYCHHPSQDIEEGLPEQTNETPNSDILADAVLVDDQEVFDAEVVSADQGSNDKQSDHLPHDRKLWRRGWWENKYFVTAMVLVVLIIAGSIIAGIVVAVQSNGDELASNTSIINDNSQLVTDISVTDNSISGNTNIQEVSSLPSEESGPTTDITAEPTTAATITSTIPPSNDECEHATAVDLSSLPIILSGSTAGATSDVYGEMCGVSTDARGVWYSFVGNGLSTSVSLAKSWIGDPQISLFSSPCSTLVCESDLGSTNQVDFVSVDGKLYHLLVTGKRGSAVGDFELTLDLNKPTQPTVITTTTSTTTTSTTTTSTTTSPKSNVLPEDVDVLPSSTIEETESLTVSPPTSTTIIPTRDSGNDKCENARVITDLPASRAGTTVIATPDFVSALEDTCYVSLESKGVWYSLANNSRRIVRLEYQLHTQGLGDSVLSIFTGSCGGGSSICFGYALGDSNWYGENLPAVYEFLAEDGETYLFLISGENAQAAGEYEFRVTEHDIPSNDNCEGAVDIDYASLPTISNGETYGGTPDFTDSSLNTCDMNWYTRGLWYRILGRGTVIRLEYQLHTQDLGDSVLSIFTGSCGDTDRKCFGKALGDSNWYGENLPAVYEFLAEEGEMYSLLLSGENFNAAGKYDFKVSEYPIPSNDKCEDAQPIDSLPFAAKGLSTLGATPDFDQTTNNDCMTFNWYSRGVWYRFVGRGTITRLEYQLHTQDLGDSVLSIFTGSCGDTDRKCFGTTLGDSNWYGENLPAVYEFLAEEGETYLVLLSGENFNAAGKYDFKVSEYPIPANDECQNAIPILSDSLPITFPGTTVGAIADFDVFDKQCGGTEDNRGVWYSFLGNGKLMFVSYSTSYASQLSLLRGACNNLVCENNYEGLGSFFFVPMNGVEYFVLLSGTSFPEVGDYELSIEQYEPPENDSCGNAIKISQFPFSQTGDLQGATPDFDVDTVQCGDASFGGVWFSFVGTGKAIELEFKTVGTDVNISIELSLFQGPCGQLECTSNLSGNEANVVSMTATTMAGVRYQILVSAFDYMIPPYDKIPFQLTMKELVII
eukprot:g5141.t1 g5141   contig19:16318-20671(-)